MTLDIAKFISNSIRTQAKIQHLDIRTKTVSEDEIPESVAKIISSEYGQKYLLDADYVSFFWGPIGKEQIKQLFNVVDKALGKSANKLTDTDFKKIDVKKDIVDVDVEAKAEVDGDDDEEEEDVEEVEEKLDEDDSTKPTPPEAHFFLKITLK